MPRHAANSNTWNRPLVSIVGRLLTLGYVRSLVHVHARSQPDVLQQSVALALTRRWWAVLSVARDEAVAASLDPSDTVTELGHPPMDPIDVWLRDPVGPSVLGGG